MISGHFSLCGPLDLVQKTRTAEYSTAVRMYYSICKTHPNLTDIMRSEGRRTQKSTVKPHSYQAQNQAESVCGDVRSQDTGSFVGLADWEGPEGCRGAGDVLILCLGAAYTDADTLSCPLMICAHFCVLYFSQKFPLKRKTPRQNVIL